MADRLVVRGAREHNLKDVSLDLPRDALIVFTGLSGSGKSSLAFDTIFAEGQRRYVESLSAYARQFLGQMDKPDVDFIEGLSPAVSIDQKSTSRNPRSTVGTITEVYDYLRLLYARAGTPHCPQCGRVIARQQPVADRRPGPRARGGHPLPGPRAGGPRPQGRVRRPVRRPADQGVQPRPRRRRRALARRAAEAQEAGEAHDRGGRRPPDRQGLRQAPPHRLGRDRARARRRPGGARLRRPPRGRPGAGAHLLGAPRLPVRRPELRGARAALVLASTARSAPAPSAPASAPARRSTRSSSSPTRRPASSRASSPRGAPATTSSTSAGSCRRSATRSASRSRRRGRSSRPRSRRPSCTATRPRCTSATATGTAASAATTPPTRASSRSSSGGTRRPRATPAASASRATCARCRARSAVVRASSPRSWR